MKIKIEWIETKDKVRASALAYIRLSVTERVLFGLMLVLE